MISTLLAGAIAIVAAGPNITVTTVDETTFSGELTRLDRAGVALTVDGKESLVAADALAKITWSSDEKAAPVSSVQVECIDGSRLSAESLTMHDETAVPRTAADGETKIPFHRIRSILFGGPLANATEREDWTRILGRAETDDLIVVRRAEALDYHPGVLLAIDEEKVEFDIGGDVLPVPLERIRGVIPRQARDVPLAETLCEVHLLDGGRLVAADVTAKDDAVRVRTTAGVELTLPWSALRSIDFGGGRFEPLASLTPESVEWTPYLPIAGVEVGDASSAASEFLGTNVAEAARREAILAGKRYEASLLLRSKTVVKYDLPEAFTRFQATLGVDDRAEIAGDVRVEIRGDNRLLFDETVTRSGGPAHVDVDLTNVGRLTITVDFADDGGFGDALQVCNARLVR